MAHNGRNETVKINGGIRDLPANLEESSRSKRGRKEGKKRKRKARRGGQDGKINSMYRERADVDGVESGRI